MLGLVFEDHPDRVHVATVRVAPWFSNLLPEGRLRHWIAGERGVNRQREMELEAHVGHDLPGAVRVLVEGEAPVESCCDERPGAYAVELADGVPWPGVRFSLAGVAMKFSMLLRHEKLTIPAHGEGGDLTTTFALADRPAREGLERVAVVCGCGRERSATRARWVLKVRRRPG